jgi:hypothetical protein
MRSLRSPVSSSTSQVSTNLLKIAACSSLGWLTTFSLPAVAQVAAPASQSRLAAPTTRNTPSLFPLFPTQENSARARHAFPMASPLSATPAPYLTHEFINKDCLKTDSCDLKSFKLEVWKSSSVKDELDPQVHDLIWNDLMVAGYETKDIPSLEKYGIVQFIQGCQISKALINGKSTTLFNTRRSFFDFDVPFHHPNWVVDSMDVDPLYASIAYDPAVYGSIPPDQWKRQAAYRINKPNFFVDESPEQQSVFQFRTPIEPKLYISDMPTGSYGAADRKSPNFSYPSMHFHTCIFKMSDIPEVATPDWNGNGKAIACFDWANNHHYDAAQDRFVDAKAIEPICLDKSLTEKLYVDDNTAVGQAPLDWTQTSKSLGLPTQSCDAMFGVQTSRGLFAGDICTDDFKNGHDSRQFIKNKGADQRFVPNTFLSHHVEAGTLASIHLSTLRPTSIPNMAQMFKELKAHAIEVVTAQAGQTDADLAVVERMKTLEVRILKQGAGCEGGAELSAEYDPVVNAIRICPAWTNLPNESILEMFANRIADALDACNFKPVFTMTTAFIQDLKLANPLKVGICFQPDPDLRSATIVNLVLNRLEEAVDAGQTEFETIQVDLDNALLKCGLITPSVKHAMPRDFSHYVTQDVWNCGRQASGEPRPSTPNGAPWKDKKACGYRVRDIVSGALGADLMSYYLRAHPEVAQPETKATLLYSALHETCMQQGLVDPTLVGSMERLGLYLSRPEIRAAVGCSTTSTPVVCQSKLFNP